MLVAFLTIPDPGLAAIIGSSGFDVVVIDAEHGPFSPSSIRSCIDAIAGTPARSVIRVPSGAKDQISRALDLGAEGVLIPMVGDDEAAESAVRASRYAPEGNRGVGTGHAALYGANFPQYIHEANSKVAVIAMIESASGVENSRAILGTKGLDGIIIGPADLSADMGLLGQPKHPEVQDAIRRVIRVALEASVTAGIGCEPDEVMQFEEAGISLFACYFDGSSIASGARDVVTRAGSSFRRANASSTGRPSYLESADEGE